MKWECSIPHFLIDVFCRYFGKWCRLTPVPEVKFIVGGDDKQLLSGVEGYRGNHCLIVYIPNFTATLYIYIDIVRYFIEHDKT